MADMHRHVGLCLSVIGFSIGEIQDLVISEPVCRYVEGIYIDPYTAMRLGVGGTREALRIHSGKMMHPLKILLGFNAPQTPFEQDGALHCLTCFIAELTPQALLMNASGHGLEWTRSVARLLATTRRGPPCDIMLRQGETAGFRHLNPDRLDLVEFDQIDGDRKASRSFLKKSGQRRLLILHPGLITPKNKTEHERLLSECCEESS